MKKNLEMQVFKCSSIKTVSIALIFAFTISYFFYRSILGMIICAPVGLIVLFKLNMHEIEKEKTIYLRDFRDCIGIVSGYLKAGYSVENAFVKTYGDVLLVSGENSKMCKELDRIKKGLAVNISLEELLTDMGKRSDLKEISEFAEVFSISKRSGGNLPGIIENSTGLISDKFAVKEEIETMVSGKRIEFLAMMATPFLMMSYVNICYKNYFELFYHNPKGVMIMTACLAVYVAASLLGLRMLEEIQKC